MSFMKLCSLPITLLHLFSQGNCRCCSWTDKENVSWQNKQIKSCLSDCHHCLQLSLSHFSSSFWIDSISRVDTDRNVDAGSTSDLLVVLTKGWFSQRKLHNVWLIGTFYLYTLRATFSQRPIDLMLVPFCCGSLRNISKLNKWICLLVKQGTQNLSSEDAQTASERLPA